jgi:hypothetical protein
MSSLPRRFAVGHSCADYASRALAGCVNADFLDSDQVTPEQADVQSAQENHRVILLSGVYFHSDADAVLRGPSRIMIGYRKHFLEFSAVQDLNQHEGVQATEESERFFLPGRYILGRNTSISKMETYLAL